MHVFFRNVDSDTFEKIDKDAQKFKYDMASLYRQTNVNYQAHKGKKHASKTFWFTQNSIQPLLFQQKATFGKVLHEILP